MTSALIGLALILLISVVTVALGALSRLLASWIAGPSTRADGPLTPLERVTLGNELIVHDLEPDSVHPVARTAARDGWSVSGGGSRRELERDHLYFFAATHGLR